MRRKFMRKARTGSAEFAAGNTDCIWALERVHRIRGRPVDQERLACRSWRDAFEVEIGAKGPLFVAIHYSDAQAPAVVFRGADIEIWDLAVLA